MAVVTISRSSNSGGKEVAEEVARRLRYECVGREVVLGTSEEFDVPETALARAIHDAPSVLDRFTGIRQRYVVYAQCALMQRARQDNVVYHGPGGHFLLPSVAHVLKIRVIADIESRVRRAMQSRSVLRDEALRMLAKEDEERREWSRKLYGLDGTDASLYDLAVHIDRVSTDEVVDTICRVASLEGFRTTPESWKAMEDAALACYVKARLVGLKPDIEVQADGGVVTIQMGTYASHDAALTRDIHRLVRGITGVREVLIAKAVMPDLTA